MPEQWIPASTTLSDVLATHRRRLDELTRQVQSMWTVIKVLEDQQSRCRASRRHDEHDLPMDGQEELFANPF